jgi:FMN phosphatase YigB (HAD superfamily)
MSLVFSNVELLCLDAGNTVIFLDHERLATLSAQPGFTPSRASLVEAEGRAKIRAERGTLVHACVSARPEKTIQSWAKMVATILVEGGLQESRAQETVDTLWPHHVSRNLWSLVAQGLPESLRAFRKSGRRIALVSNSEGMLESLFTELAIRDCFDVLLDSGILGIEKPDPRIFEMALTQGHASKDNALHLGDVYATDILGAQAAGIACALLDPFGHYEGKHPNVPRVTSVADVVRSILGASATFGV